MNTINEEHSMMTPPPSVEAAPQISESQSALSPMPSRWNRFRHVSGSVIIRLLKIILSITPLAAVIGLAVLLLAPLPIAQDKIVVIPRGAGVAEIANILELDHPEALPIRRLLFRLAARLAAADHLQAGEYQLQAGQHGILDIVLTMRDGKMVVRTFTIVEGKTSAAVVAALNNDAALQGEVTTAPDEGTLLPETYRYTYGENRTAIIDRAVRGHAETLATLWAGRDTTIPITSPAEAVIIASMIEKETGSKAGERARIAGVFYNRLRIGMRLQSDPTVIYAVTLGKSELGRGLTHTDLALPSPYNTYAVAGLPPTPICNAGRAAIEAALHPETHDLLYFVADGTGGHAFASTLAEHNRNVAAWQEIRRGTIK